MQPNFRQYYNLEELWGDKPVRLKFGATKPVVNEAATPAKSKKEIVKPEANLKRSNAAKKGVQEAFPSKAQLKKTLAAKVPAKKTTVKKVTVNAPAKAAATKAPAKRATVRKTATRKA
jgi:ribosome-associated protein